MSDHFDVLSLTRSISEYIKANLGAEDGGHIQLHGTGAVKNLESRLSAYCGVRHTLAVSNCTTGLMAVALALGLQNVEVIVPPLVYGGSISGLLLLGNRLRFCDIDRDTLTLDPESVRRSISPRTRAILAIDLFGVPCRARELKQIADEHGIPLICDSAQSLGAISNGVPIGSIPHASVLSFTSGKTLFAGEGGAILTNDTKLYNNLLWLTQHPNRQRRELGLAIFNEVSLNARIHPLGALWADATFESAIASIRDWQEKCLQRIEFLNATGLVEEQSFSKGTVPAFFRLTAALKAGVASNHLVRAMATAGHAIEVQEALIQPIFKSSSFAAVIGKRTIGVRRCPNAEQASSRRIAIRDCPQRG